MKVKIRDKNKLNKTLKTMKELNKKRVEVGYLQQDEMAMIAGVQEFGARIKVTDKMRAYLAATGLPLKDSTKEITIPERSFLRTGAKDSEKIVVKEAEKYIIKALTGKMNTKKYLEKLGEKLKEGIQEAAEDINSPKNHPYTVELKGDNDILENKGKLLDAIEVKVK